MTNETAPAAGIAKGVPVTDPRHWSHFRRPQTDDERLELAAAQWVPDETMERSRLVRDRHPDLFSLVSSDATGPALAAYERKRDGAVAAGRRVPELAAEVVEAIDQAADEFRATRTMPAELVDVDRSHRAAFRAAVQAPDFDAALVEWFAWIRDVEARNAFVNRQIRASRAALSRGLSDQPVLEPRFLREIEAAVAGGSSLGTTIGGWPTASKQED